MNIVGEGPERTYCLLRFEGGVHRWTAEVQIVACRFPVRRCFQWGCDAPLTDAPGYQMVDVTEEPQKILWTFASCEQHLLLLEDAIQSIIQQLDSRGERLSETTVEISHRQSDQYGPLADALVEYGLIKSPKKIRQQLEQERHAEEKRGRRIEAELRQAEARGRKEAALLEQKEREKAAHIARDAARREAHRKKMIGRAEPVLAQLIKEGLITDFKIEVHGETVEASVTPIDREPLRWVVKGSKIQATVYEGRYPQATVVVASWESAETRQSFLEALREE